MQYPDCENPSIQVTSGSNQSLNSGRCALLGLANHKTLKMTAICRHLHYRHSSHNREFHNVNCRFCGAIHDVDRACISVLSQVIHNVNERKMVQTNMISFVSHGAGILTIMEASAEHDCCSEAQRNARRTGTSYFVCTVFLFINL